MENEWSSPFTCLFVFQAAIIAHTKEAAAETLREVRDDLSRQDNEAEEKRSQARQGDGEEVLKGDEVGLNTPQIYRGWRTSS